MNRVENNIHNWAHFGSSMAQRLTSGKSVWETFLVERPSLVPTRTNVSSDLELFANRSSSNWIESCMKIWKFYLKNWLYRWQWNFSLFKTKTKFQNLAKKRIDHKNAVKLCEINVEFEGGFTLIIKTITMLNQINWTTSVCRSR